MSELATEWTSLRKTIFGAKTAPQPATLHATTAALQKKGDPIKQGVGRKQVNDPSDVQIVCLMLGIEANSPLAQVEASIIQKQKEYGIIDAQGKLLIKGATVGAVLPNDPTWVAILSKKALNQKTADNMVFMAKKLANVTTEQRNATNEIVMQINNSTQSQAKLDANILTALIATESTGKEEALSPSGKHKGLMQIGEAAWTEGVAYLVAQGIITKDEAIKDYDFYTKLPTNKRNEDGSPKFLEAPYDGKKNIQVGTAYQMVILRYLNSGIKKTGLILTPDHKDFYSLLKIGHNLGPSALAECITTAGTLNLTNNSENPNQTTDPLWFAIKARADKMGDTKYAEVANFDKRIKTGTELLDAADGGAGNFSNSNNNSINPHRLPPPPVDNKPNPHRLPPPDNNRNQPNPYKLPPPPINNPTTSIKYAIQIYESTESPGMEDIKKMNNYAEPQGFVVGSGIASNEDKYFCWVTDRYWTGEEGKALVEKNLKKTQAVFPKAKIIELDSNGRKK